MISPTNEPADNDPNKAHHAGVPITEKVCLVTGGGQKRGIAVAEALAMAGVKTIALTYAEEREPAHELYVKIQSMGVGCLLAKMDVTDRKSVRKVLLWVKDQVGQIDVLINAEHIAWPDDFDTASPGDRLQAVGVNIRAQALTADEVLPFMSIQRTGGLVIGVGVQDEITSALDSFDDPGVPRSVAAAIFPMRVLAASRQVTISVLPFGEPDTVANAVVRLATA
ncbi:MAG: SDR family NAD(P)-dependent oxidoreductase [Dehalococcoidia bacterium]